MTDDDTIEFLLFPVASFMLSPADIYQVQFLS